MTTDVEYRQIPLKIQTLTLKNRVNHDATVLIDCRLYGDKFFVCFVAKDSLAAKQLTKSAEHFAFQLQQLLGVDSEHIEFVVYQSDIDEQWLRWNLQWVGTSPIHTGSKTLSINKMDHPVLTILKDGQSISLDKILPCESEKAIA